MLSENETFLNKNADIFQFTRTVTIDFMFIVLLFCERRK